MSVGEVIDDGFYEPKLERGSDMWMEANQSSARLFEKSIISALRDERENVQKKTFTKWINSHLQKVGAHINDLYHDLQDGRQLILLLEILSAEKLPKPSKGRMRIHLMENVEKCLVFLKQKEVHLTNIGNHDIVDGNPKITLGLIWTIILRFQIQDLMIEMDSGEKRSAKEALLLWCQSKTQGYKNVNVTNFSTSWKDGLAFAALIHKHRPDVIQYDKLIKEEPIKNLNVAFDTAERQLGILPLLDAPDLDVDYPDEKSIMTYVATYYQYFSKQKQVEVSGSRIQKVIKHAVDNEKLVNDYETLTSNLREWIIEKIGKLQDRTFGNSLITVQQQMMEFNLYRTQEKPPKFVEKCNLEVQMFEIASQLRLNHQKMYEPKDGLLVNDINNLWQQMEREEHAREVALREELIRQQQLEELASRYDRKANLREVWLNENCKLLSVDNFGEDLPAVEASVKKHEAIETDIKAYEARIHGVRTLAEKLGAENFHRIEWIKSTTEKINVKWSELLDLLEKRSSRLRKHHELHKIFQEMIYIIDWMDDVKVGLSSEDYGNHLLGVEDLLQKHELVEADITAQVERVTQSDTAAKDFLEKSLAENSDGYKPDAETIKNNREELETSYQEICQLAKKRRQMLEESLRLHTFYRDLEEEDIWLSEKEYFVSSAEYGSDINTTTLLLQQHGTLEQELAAKKSTTNKLLDDSNTLLQEMPYAAEKVNEHVTSIKSKWEIVDQLSAKRRARLEEVLRLHQYYADCREIEADMNELEAPVSSTDYGHDVDTVNELLKKEKVLEEELNKIEAAIEAVENQRQSTLGEEDRDTEDVVKAKTDLDEHFKNLKDKLADRHQRLLGSLALFKLYNEADLVTSWIIGRRSQLTTYLKVERSDDMERCKAIQLRFEGFEQELSANQERMKTVNSLASELKEKNPEEAPLTEERINNLNSSWDELKKEAEERKKELVACLLIQNLYCEMTETRTWMVEKSRLLASVEDPGVDLSSVITLQRRLNTIERDIAALPSKMQDLHAQAVELSREYPEEAVNIQACFDSLQQCWDNLSKMVKQKNESLAEMGELKRFIMSLDEFLNWLTQTSEQCASEELPQSLSEAESLLDAHFDVKTVIEQHSDDYNTLMEEGPKYVRDDQNDLQTQSLRQQMLDVKDGWQQLHVLWDSRKEQLEQSMNHQLFLRDAKQCEAALGQQELYLSRPIDAPTADFVQEEIKKLEEFIKKMDTHDEKINHVIQFADQLRTNGHYAKDKVIEKAAYINERRNTNRENANDLLAKLREDLRLKQFLEDSTEVIDWMNERMHSATDESYKEDTSNMRSKLLKHAAFEAELNANKIKIDALKKTGAELIEEKEETRPEVEKQLQQIDELWDVLNNTSAEKKAHLSEVNRQQQFGNEVTNLDKWITEIHTQLSDKEIGTDITTARALYNKHKKTEKDIDTKKQRMIELCANPEEVDEEKLVAEQQIMEERFCALEEPMQDRGMLLEESLKFYQFKRDVENAQLWIDEKEPILKSDSLGDSLHDVQRMKKRHSNLCTEVDGHEPLITALHLRGEEMVNESHPKAQEVQQLSDALKTKWDNLKELSTDFQGKLDVGLQAKKYYFDATEAESWMSEQELFLLGEERGKDEEQVQKLLKKHQATENAIKDYEDTIKELAKEARKMVDEDHIESESIQLTQSKIEDLYSQLKELANEKQGKLDENLKLFQFNREVEDLKSWIADREVIASSEDIGQDFDNVQMIEERFDRFADETRNIGTERVSTVNTMCDQLIGAGHQDASLIGEWKEDLNDSWQGLLELLNTRREVLNKAHEMHRYFQEAKLTLVMIQEKENSLTEDLGRDQQSVYALQRQHKAFEADLKPLGLKVEDIQQFAGELKSQYAGDKLIEILQREDEVVDAWKALLQRVAARSAKLGQSDEYQRLIIMIQNLLLWIQDMRLQIESDERPKDIVHCETLMGTHQGRKSEIDAKGDKFKMVQETANELIARDHYASIEIKERIENLLQQRNILDDEWDIHWEDLQMTLDVMQFARDAHLADHWIAQNEHVVQGKDAVKSLDEIVKLIEKHNNFERLLSKQEDRFNQLERLTTFELREARQRQLEAAKKEREEKERLERELAEQRERDLEKKRVEEEKEKERLRAASASPAQSTQSQRQQSEEQAQAAPSKGHMNGDEKPSQSELAIGVDGVKMLGHLSRKPTKEAGNKKAHSRVWKQFFVVLKGTDLMFYSNEKEARNRSTNAQIISTTGSGASVASDYSKKKNVLRLVLASGAEYLLQADSVNDMTTWIQSIGSVTTTKDDEDGRSKEEIRKRLSTMGSPSRPLSVVEQSNVSAPEEGSKKEKKRKSLFGNKKKSQKDKSSSELPAKND